VIGVTGWQGFIGLHLVGKLDNPLCFQGDLRIIADVKEFVRKCDRIYHVAGLNRESEGVILANNLVATGNLILATRLLGVSPEIIFISSVQSQSKPNSEYGTTKLIEEKIVKMAERWCIFRLPNVYGEGCRPFYNSVVATFAYQIVNGFKVIIEDADAIRNFIYVEDLAERLLNPRIGEYMDVRGERMTIAEVYKHLKAGDHPKLKRCLDYFEESKNEISFA
jgi:UDP-2-acetamido-2,6-beta-L-arabino-hexul-4-ose reductase